MVVSRVEAVRRLETVAPLSGAVLNDVRLSCSDLEAPDDDVLSVGLSGLWRLLLHWVVQCSMMPDSRTLIRRRRTMMFYRWGLGPAVCCAQLDDFDWVVPDYVPDILLSGRDIEVGVTDLTQDIHVLPDMFPVVSAVAATVLMPLPAGAEAEPQFKIRRETAPALSPLAEEMTLRVATVGLSDDGSDHPAEFLDSEPDCCFMDVGVLVPERSPVVSARGGAVPTSLPTITEVFSSAVLAGGGGSLLRQPP